MTRVGPAQSTNPAKTERTLQPSANVPDRAFAQTLATAQQETEAAPPTLVAAPASALQQLAFLNQPKDLALPAFLFSRWQPRDVGGSAAPVRSAAPHMEAAGNPYRGALAAQMRGFYPEVAPVAAASAGRGPDGVSGMQGSSTALPLSAFPRPKADTGRGIHWIPTTSQAPAVIDKYVREAVAMGIKWVTFLNDGANTTDNDYLVKKLVANGIEPVMRIYTDGGAPIQGDLAQTVRHYRKLGVHYFQLYNEPNLRIENQGRAPDPQRYAARWLDAARQVVAGGGYPGFGSLSPTPGLAPGAAPGDMDDLKFLREALRAVVAQGGGDVLDRSWLSVHNYGQAHLRVRDYDGIVRQELGRSLPQIGTEAGIYPGDTLSQSDATQIVADAYSYLPQREDYYFAYTYWIIANESGRGHDDAAWNHQALFRPDGQDPLVALLKQEALV